MFRFPFSEEVNSLPHGRTFLPLHGVYFKAADFEARISLRYGLPHSQALYLIPECMIIPYLDKSPSIGKSVFVAPNAVVAGEVEIGDHSSIWFGSTVRGDVCWIKIGHRTNIQDNSLVHVTHDIGPTRIGSDITIGHSCVIHACTIEDGCLIGMGSTILDGANIGKNSLIGAGSLITGGVQIPPNSLAFGRPAKVIRTLRKDELEMMEQNAARYVQVASNYMKSISPPTSQK